jgi:hypothetical protein
MAHSHARTRDGGRARIQRGHPKPPLPLPVFPNAEMHGGGRGGDSECDARMSDGDRITLAQLIPVLIGTPKRRRPNSPAGTEGSTGDDDDAARLNVDGNGVEPTSHPSAADATTSSTRPDTRGPGTSTEHSHRIFTADLDASPGDPCP